MADDRICPLCRLLKPRSDFGIRIRRCAACRAAKKAERQEKERQRKAIKRRFPEEISKGREYLKRPEVKERLRELRSRPEAKIAKRAYDLERNKDPTARTKKAAQQRARASRPEVAARRRIQSRIYERQRKERRRAEREVARATFVLPATKTCRECGRTLPVSAFAKHRQTCRDCRRKYQLNRYHTPEVKERYKLWDKNRTRSPEQMARRKTREKEYKAQPQIKERIRARQKLPTNAAKAREKALNRYHQKKTDPEYILLLRVREAKRRAAGRLSTTDIKAIMRMQRGRCAICRKALKDKYHVDHIVPIAKGGRSEASNTQILCPPCNLSKHDADPIDHMRSLGFLL